MDGLNPRGSAAPSRRIICQRTDGLGGRLLILLWSLRLARKLDAGVLVFWPKLQLFYENATAHGDIFDLYRLASPPLRERLQIIDDECHRYIRPRELNLPRRKVHDPADFLAPLDEARRGERLPVIVGHWEGPILMAGETAREALAEMPAIFAELPIRRDLTALIHRLDKAHKLFRMVAVHIRRGEIVRNLREAAAGFRLDDPSSRELLRVRTGTFARRCMSLDNFAQALRPFVDQGRTILVFSDEPNVHEDLIRALGTPNVLPATSLATGDFTAMQQAFIETCLMSRCHCIVGARSAYSWLGNVIGGNRRIQLGIRSRTAEDCAAFALQSVAEVLAALPERASVERGVHEEIDRIFGHPPAPPT